MILRILKISLAGAAVGLLLFTAWFSLEFSSSGRKPAEKTATFEVEEGSSARQIARSLQTRNIIKRRWPFLLGYRLFFSSQSLKAGEYVLELPLSPKQVLEILIKGQVRLRPVTIPEGLTRIETAEHLEKEAFALKAEFLAASRSPDIIREWDENALDLEGYLFPETYHFPKDTTAEQIVAAMVSQFQEVFTTDWIRRSQEQGLTPREIVILASLIEKETSRPEERPLISAVFHNRLRLGMKLDCDPTIVYVLKNAGRFRGRLRTKDLKMDSPYNTYIYGGLPPGPIANPGRAALEAALHPADVDFLYFVSKNDGSHHFSRTYREHVNAVNIYQRGRR